MLTNSPEILFHNQDIDFDLQNQDVFSDWISKCVESELKELGNINFVFCSDDRLHKMNVQYLNHDTLTDVITFPLSNEHIAGDIFISIDRIKENAKIYEVDEQEELARVMIHGVLHLIGYGDKSDSEIKIMREKEQFYLNQVL